MLALLCSVRAWLYFILKFQSLQYLDFFLYPSSLLALSTQVRSADHASLDVAFKLLGAPGGEGLALRRYSRVDYRIRLRSFDGLHRFPDTGFHNVCQW